MKQRDAIEPIRRHTPRSAASHAFGSERTAAPAADARATAQRTLADAITRSALVVTQRITAARINESPRMLGQRRHTAALHGSGLGTQTSPVQRKLSGSGEALTETQLGKVKKLDEFLVGEKKFVMLKKVASEESKEGEDVYIHDVANNTNTLYSEWTKQPWRTWKGDLERGGESGQRKDVPPSTASIPLTLYKRVNVEHLDSISKTPLESTPQRIVFQGYSKGSKYMTRDLAIAAVWLGKSTQPGESMQPVSGSFIDLEIKVPAAFRDAYLRDVYAVLHGDDNKVSDTVLCFAPIAPAMVSVTLSKEALILIKERDEKTRLKVGDNVLARIDSKDIKNIIAVLGGGSKSCESSEEDD